MQLSDGEEPACSVAAGRSISEEEGCGWTGWRGVVNGRKAKGRKRERGQGDGKGEREGEEESDGKELKRPRLHAWQIDCLEQRFQESWRLDPDRKQRLARELGVRPRQVAVWFQNRRVRWKSKQKEVDLEGMKGSMDELRRECSSLQSMYSRLKGDYKALLSENESLMNKVRGEVTSVAHQVYVRLYHWQCWSAAQGTS